MFFTYLALIFIAIFFALSIYDRRKISNGLFLTIGLFFGLLAILGFVLNLSDQNDLMRVIATGFFILLLLMFPFFILGIAVGLVANGRVMIKKEGRRLTNLLPLFAGLAILTLIVWIVAQGAIIQNLYLTILLMLILMVVGYFTFFFISFLISTIVCQLNFPCKNQDFIIVLGSGLMGDRVPPLLAGRLDRAIHFYTKQVAKTGKQATIIVSGGQGPDEDTSEANAMRLYLLEKGIPEECILMEDKSTNTLENMQFSKKMMDGIMGKYNSIFSTNNFHLFRASLYAKKAGLKSQGIGAKTALYYMPNALIREFIAIVVMYKWVHVIIVMIMLLPFLILAIVSI
ncbi:YdcF family protein [Listeria costaricensis]|uniref:YdcF family protein n=1 Tax=Listeria costaricensis TaxID=2026604 RepID=UPI000C0746A6|nr:YdcF family protein [Listeria costaricensis]